MLYNYFVDVAISDLRAHLSDWIGRARDGNDIVVTERGVPVARLVGIESASTLDRLQAEGVIGRPATPQRPVAQGRKRPRARRLLAEVISEQRR